MRFNTDVRVWEVLDAFGDARKAYERVFARSTTPEIAKNVICVLLWLETIVGIKVLHNVATMESHSIMLSRVITEAEAVHSFILCGLYWLPLDLEGIPTIVSLCVGGRLVDFRFFKFHKDLAARGVSMIRSTVARIVFNDHLHEMMRQFEDEVDSVENPRPAPELMEPFVAQTRTPPEDSRTVFVAFSCGHPLSAQEILGYFEQRLGFGLCIERIATEQPLPWQTETPKHAVIVFRSVELRDEVMFHETAMFYRINGHDIWLQQYEPPF